MFEFANGLLLALFAALLWECVSFLRRNGVKKIPSLLHGGEERLLFGQWGADRRPAAGDWLFAIGLACYEVSVVFCNSMARENWAWVQGILAPVLDWAAFLCFGAKILLGTKYNLRGLFSASALYFIARWVYFNGHNIWWIGMVVAVLAAKDADLHKALGSFLLSGGAAMAVVLALHFAGIVAPGLTDDRLEGARSTFGYGHPNTFGGLVFGLLLAYVLYRAAKLRWLDAAVTLAVGVFLMVGPNSRTASLCSLALAAALVFVMLLPSRRSARPRLWQGIGVFSVVFFAAISYILPLLLVKNGPWNDDFGPTLLGKLDGILTCRISLSWFAYRVYDVKIAGQLLGDWPGIDNGYVFSLFQLGPVMTALILLLMAAALWVYAKNNRLPEYFCLLVLVAYAYMECQIYHITTNPTALLLCGAVYLQPAEKWAKREV